MDYIAIVNRVSRHILSLNISRKIYVVASHFKTKQNKTIKHMLWCVTLLMRTTTYVLRLNKTKVSMVLHKLGLYRAKKYFTRCGNIMH